MPRFVTSDGISLHYEDEGSGLPVLALPGLTRSGRDFDFVAPHLRDIRLLRLDARGRGQSDHADPATYSIPVEARDVLELLDHLGIERAAILGTSRGGLVAHVLAATAPDRLMGVALNDIGPKIEEEGLQAIRAYIGRAPVWTSYEDAASARAAALPGFVDVPAERWRAEVEHLFEEREGGLALRYDPRLKEPILAAFDAPPVDLWPLFDMFGPIPVACIRGANSNILSTETLAEMRRRRPDMIVAEVEGRGHVPFLDEPTSLAALRAWIDRLT
ncbi:Pimeloyl-ACP methyl ester carboxylesterase [Poseidonocella pacifica]|uniref:Pimeloyl-ACP methyl ester carboxylesterase n=1 Tax=Poseidonocella pacifica TaxID=871651 RepID=A0A1I0WKM4_9RHOB|nr:alpha/beta hydrolase [Poseidonocella pacifica]SFA88543.1 Pimeloyl-ACP methyl ester carboxylesterase [Poseidonocella pacifica]